MTGHQPINSEGDVQAAQLHASHLEGRFISWAEHAELWDSFTSKQAGRLKYSHSLPLQSWCRCRDQLSSVFQRKLIADPPPLMFPHRYFDVKEIAQTRKPSYQPQRPQGSPQRNLELTNLCTAYFVSPQNPCIKPARVATLKEPPSVSHPHPPPSLSCRSTSGSCSVTSVDRFSSQDIMSASVWPPRHLFNSDSALLSWWATRSR